MKRSGSSNGNSKMPLTRRRSALATLSALGVLLTLGSGGGSGGGVCALSSLPAPEATAAPAHIDSTQTSAAGWSVHFGIDVLNATMKERYLVPLTIEFTRTSDWGMDFEFRVVPLKDDYLRVIGPAVRARDLPANANRWSGNVSVEALFLGDDELRVELHRTHAAAVQQSPQALRVLILRNEDAWDTAFKIVVGLFVMVMYVSFGTVLDLQDLKRIVMRPIGPVIGFVGQFIVMPLLSYGIGYVVFNDMMELRLGLLFTGSTPAGGLSNILTVLLNGNINMSVTMTAISNLGAFGMMPLWIYTLGTLLLNDAHFTIPYDLIAWMSFSLLLPLFVGVVIQKYMPQASKQVAKHLQAVSLVLIVIITVFAFIVNSYLFRLFTWRILLACSALPWLGYVLGWLMAKLCRQPAADSLTIAIETGIQNTGIAIFMLKFALPQPQADITSAVPIANSVMTPLPMFALYFLRLFMRWWKARKIDVTAVVDAPAPQQVVTVSETVKQDGSADSTNNNNTNTNVTSGAPNKSTATETRDRGHDNLAADI